MDDLGTTGISSTINNGDDVDPYQVQLNAGDNAILDIDAFTIGSSLDSEIRLFDADGNQISINDDDFESDQGASVDSYLTFDVESTGTYYVGVASFINSDYDPINGATNVPRFNRARGGFYELNISVDRDDTGVDGIGGTYGNDRLNGTDQNDVFNGINGQDRIRGFAGNDLLNGGNGNDVLVGVLGDDTLNGGSRNDRLKGRAGNDLLNGDEDNDTLFGGGGRDTLLGGQGDDVLEGGGGEDTFVLTSGEGQDTIVDFGFGNDIIGLTNGVSFSDLSFSGEQIIFGSETLVTLKGVNTNSLTEYKFVSI